MKNKIFILIWPNEKPNKNKMFWFRQSPFQNVSVSPLLLQAEFPHANTPQSERQRSPENCSTNLQEGDTGALWGIVVAHSQDWGHICSGIFETGLYLICGFLAAHCYILPEIGLGSHLIRPK